MSRQTILNFSQAKAEPIWLQERRLAAFDKIEILPLPSIERVRFHRWNLGDGTISENDATANVPDFMALGDSPKLVQVGTQTLLEQLPADLIQQGLVFTDLQSALEEIPQVVEKYFGSALAYDEDKLAAYNYAYFNSAAVLYVPDNMEIEKPLEGIYLQDSDSDVPFNKHVLIIAGKNTKFSYIERFESIGEGAEKASANISVEIIAGSGSQISYSAIDRLGENVTAYISRRVKHENDSSGLGYGSYE